MKSFPPWNCLIFQIRQDFSGLYETEPLEHYKEHIRQLSNRHQIIETLKVQLLP